MFKIIKINNQKMELKFQNDKSQRIRIKIDEEK